MLEKLRLKRPSLSGRSYQDGAGDPHLTIWKAKPSNGGLIGLGGTIAALVLAAFCIVFALTSPSISLRAVVFGFLGLGLGSAAWYLGELTYGFFRMRYVITDDYLVIRSAFHRARVGLRDIESVAPSQGSVRPRRIAGIRWPGYNLSRGYLRGLGELRVFATSDLADSILIVASRRVYAISPADPDAFMETLRERAAIATCLSAPVQESETSLWRAIVDAFVLDTRARALVLIGITLNVGLFAVLVFSMSRLPLQIPVHFNPLGEPDVIGETSQIFKLPAIGLVIWLGNTLLALGLLRRERFLSYLLLGAGAFAQLVFWGATAAVLV